MPADMNSKNCRKQIGPYYLFVGIEYIWIYGLMSFTELLKKRVIGEGYNIHVYMGP